MRIRPVDMADPDEFARYYAIFRESELFERPDAPMWSEHELRVMFASSDATEEVTPHGAFDGDEMVAAGMTSFSLLDNLDKAFIHAAVEPSLRRRGIGSILLGELTTISVAAGRDVMLAESWVQPGTRETHPYRRFAEKNGFALANVEIRRVLPLPVPVEQLEAWAAEAAEYHRDYTIATFVDGVPDDLIESYCDLRNQLALDAPTGDIVLEVEAMTPEALRHRMKISKDQGRTTFIAVATDATDTVVGYTAMAVPEDIPVFVHQWGTLVQRDHRGHRLGMAVKVANLAAVQAAYPDRTLVNTQNAEINGPMVAINERLGFRPADELAEFQKIISL